MASSLLLVPVNEVRKLEQEDEAAEKKKNRPHVVKSLVRLGSVLSLASWDSSNMGWLHRRRACLLRIVTQSTKIVTIFLKSF